MKIGELKSRSSEELKDIVLSSKKELFNLRMQKATGQAVAGGRSKELKKTVARSKTLLNEAKNNVKNAAPKKAASKKKD